jgi:peptidylprolyl isomerase
MRLFIMTSGISGRLMLRVTCAALIAGVIVTAGMTMSQAKLVKNVQPVDTMMTTGMTTTRTGLKYSDVKVGTGRTADKGQTVIVNYTGRFVSNGSIFDSSEGRDPFEFKLGAGKVIAGWEEGVKGMKVGGKRVLLIPPDLAYGPSGYPPVIPPNSTLKFDVELVDIK